MVFFSIYLTNIGKDTKCQFLIVLNRILIIQEHKKDRIYHVTLNNFLITQLVREPDNQ